MPPNIITSTGRDSTAKIEDITPGSTFSISQGYAEKGGVSGSSQRSQDVIKPDHIWLIKNKRRFREPLAEFWGVFVLVLFGNGAVAQVVLSEGKKGDYQSISWGWGIGVMLGIYVAGTSGAHLNPAVTFANCVFRRFPWRKFPKYMLAQTLGAFCASGIVYGISLHHLPSLPTFSLPHLNMLTNYSKLYLSDQLLRGAKTTRTVPGYSPTASGGIFCTYPAPFMTRLGMFFSEFLASAILMFCIYALQDDNNLGAGKLTPLALFFVLFGIGACFGWETGYAINFARDFGPRLMSYCLRYGKQVWTAGGYYFWIPMVAPFLGTVAGGGIYDLCLLTRLQVVE